MRRPLPRRQERAIEETVNSQDQTKWDAEAATIAATQRSIVWRSPSRHDGPDGEEPELSEEGVFVGEGALSENIPTEIRREDEQITVKGGRERGLVVHKLIEEVLTGETGEDSRGFGEREQETLISELGVAEANVQKTGLHAPELAASVRRGLWYPRGGRTKAPAGAGNDGILGGVGGAGHNLYWWRR